MIVLKKAISDGRRGLVGWTIALVLFTGMILLVWPSIREQAAQLQQIVDAYPPALKALYGDAATLTTGPGFVRAEFFALGIPILLLIFAIGRASDAIAGDEERNAMDALLALPLDRRRVVLERAAAIGLVTLGFSLLLFLAILAGDAAYGMGVAVGPLAASVLSLALLVWAIAAASLAAGAWTGRRAVAIAAGSGLAVVSYLLDTLGKLAPALDRARWLSLWSRYDEGVSLAAWPSIRGPVVLALATALLVALAVWGFERRDVGTA